MKSKYSIFPIGITFLRTFQETNSILTALIVGCITGFIIFIIDLIWNLKQNRPIKILMVISFISCASGFFYAAYRIKTYYSANKVIKSNFSPAELEKLKTEYQKRKEINLEAEVVVVIENLKNTLSNEDTNIEMLLKQLENIDEILNNPFIVNELDVSLLSDVRKSLVDIINACAQNYPDFLNLIQKIERKDSILRTVYCDPVKVESYKILLEEGPTAYIKYFEKLIQSAQGRAKLQRLCYLREMEIDILDVLIDDNDIEEFKESAIMIISKQMTQSSYKDLSNLNIRNYIQEKLPALVETQQGRKKIVHDIRKIQKIINFCLKALCNEAERTTNMYLFNKIDMSNLINKEYGSQISTLIKNFGNSYE